MPRKRKKIGTRKVEKRLFIICEGKKDKSESAYFKSFIKSCSFYGDKIDVRVIDTEKNTGKELVREAEKSRELPHDIVWVVYDKDGYTKHAETFDLARQNKVKIAFSSISFEYWILLHYENSNKSFYKSHEIIKYLKNKNYIDYKKNDVNLFNETKSLLNKAKINAIKSQQYQISGNKIGTPVYEFNPYTNLNELILEIEKLQN